ncbi:hypothetical protein ACHAXR_003733 [Thalassiosira sp. AJA248-18]
MPIIVTTTPAPVVITPAPAITTPKPILWQVASPAPNGTNNDIVPTKQPVSETSPTTSPPTDAAPAISMQEYQVSSTMVLYNSEEMDDDALNMWIDVTEETIRSEITNTVTGVVDPELVQVTVILDNQNVVSSESIRGRRVKRRTLSNNHPTNNASSSFKGKRGRNMQQVVSSTTTFPLQIEYTAIIQFPSESKDDLDANKVVAAAFQTEEKQQAYIADLKGEGDFQSVTSMSTKTMEDVIIIDPGNDNADGATDGENEVTNGNNSALIGGIVGGVCVLLFATAAIAIYLRRTKQRKDSQSTKSSTTTTQPSSATTKQLSHSPQVGLDMVGNRRMESPGSPGSNARGGQLDFGIIESKEGDMDDVSTIGDPYFGDAVGQPMDADNTVGESMVSSQQERFVYGIRPHGIGMDSSRVGGSTIGGGTINSGFTSGGRMKFEDDATFENIYQIPSGTSADDDEQLFERLTVVCPSGKLGIVLDNPAGDMPIVYAIKETSPLHGKIRVGDLLLSVDEVDCRGMSAHTLSNFLSSRSQSPSRTLVLARGPGSAANL